MGEWRVYIGGLGGCPGWHDRPNEINTCILGLIMHTVRLTAGTGDGLLSDSEDIPDDEQPVRRCVSALCT